MSKKLIGARGQGMTIDLAFAVLIFLLVAGSLSWVWSNKAQDFERELHESDLRLKAERTLGMLVTTPGQSNNWEDLPISMVTTIGLAKRDRVLDEEKVRQFEALGNSAEPSIAALAKQKLLIGANSYYFRLLDPTIEDVVEAARIIRIDIGTPDEKAIAVGTKPDEHALQATVTVKRPVVFAYHREGEDSQGEKSQHEAIAELTLYSTIRTW